MLPPQGQNGSSSVTPSSGLSTSKKLLLTNAIFSFFINLMLLAPSLYMMQVYNRVLPRPQPVNTGHVDWLGLFHFAALAVLETVRAQIMVRLGGKPELDLNQRVIEAAFLATLQSDERKVRQTAERLRPYPQLRVEPSAFRAFRHPLGAAVRRGRVPVPPAAWQHSFRRFRRPPRVTLVHHLVTRPYLEVASCKAADVNGCMERSLRNAQTLEAMGMLVNLQERWLRQRNEALHMQARAADRLAFSPA